jgi:hypothetical protein
MPLQETSGSASYDAFGGGAAERVFIEDVFSCFLYTGNGSTQTITNGIDLSTKGGLVWIKNRGAATNNLLFDTPRGTGTLLSSNLTNSATAYTGFGSFNSNGFSLNLDPGSAINASSNTYASWTFRKQPKFFDVVTYTGTGSNRTVAHNLGSVPGCIIVKRTDTTADWQVYHRSLANTEYLVLNTAAAKATGATRWNSTTPTSTVFSLGTDSTVNASGGTYVAYLFAHDAGGFGLSGTDNVISCGSYTGNGSATGPSVTLGWEPQWLLVKNATTAGREWFLMDNMRGFTANGTDAMLFPNNSNSESSQTKVGPTATGFQPLSASGDVNASGDTYIYIAIRRGPMKVPTSGTSVFSPQVYNTPPSSPLEVTTNFVVDSLWAANTASGGTVVFDRLRSTSSSASVYLLAYDTGAETSTTGISLQSNTSIIDSGFYAGFSYTPVYWSFRRAPGFMDVVCDTGTGSAHTITHNLGAVPELMIRKKRSAADNWIVYANNDPTDYLILNSTAATADLDTMWNDTAPTSTVFTVGTNDDVNQNTGTFVTYLFATLAGVSKVGSYTGNGSSQTINCGFTGGARFVLIKRINSTGDWYVWDSARGIVAGNDPHLSLNTNAGQVTTDDSVDTNSTGFIVNQLAATNINVSSASYIFLAIA